MAAGDLHILKWVRLKATNGQPIRAAAAAIIMAFRNDILGLHTEGRKNADENVYKVDGMEERETLVRILRGVFSLFAHSVY